MAAVVRLQPAGGTPAAWVVAKGAPEVMAQFLSDAPPDYEESYKAHAAQGSRCIPADRILPVDYVLSHSHILCVWAGVTSQQSQDRCRQCSLITCSKTDRLLWVQK